MQVILKPVNHPELGEIIIKDSLFAIGRHETPFSNYDAQIVEKLSRRHARIFEQDGTVYIADLGSLNGTTVNGQTVETLPVRLQRGDEICFTGYLCYQIEILGAAANRSAERTAALSIQLILHPDRRQPQLEPIVVTQFPFLINKASDVFTRYKDTLPKEVSYLSRRHAHIFFKDQKLYIEDLGSTNGTFVAGVRLEEHALPLQNEDTVAFGGDYFSYRVEMVYAEEELTNQTLQSGEPLTGTARQITETSHGIDDVTRTTFVTSATSFLDIYCIEDDIANADEHQGRPVEVGGKKGVVADPAIGGRRSLPGRTVSLIREFRAAFSGEHEGRSARLWLAAAALVGVVVMGFYLANSPKREIRQLLEQEAYVDAVVEANRYLQTKGDDKEVSEQATEALLKAAVPAWLDFVLAGEFSEAERQLERVALLSRFSPSDRQILDLMHWVTQLEQFVEERGGADSAVIMFEQEERIEEILAWWDADAKLHRRSLGSISHYVPAFVELRARVFSHLRRLESQQALDIAAIERLIETVDKKLQADNAESLHGVFADFEDRYPRIIGLEKLRSDLDNYLEVDAEIHSSNWIQAYRLLSADEYETPVFRQRILFLKEKVLPSAEHVNRYDVALSAWQDGELETAMAELEVLSSERWGEVAERRLQRSRRLISDFEALKQLKGSPGYEKKLLTFYTTLIPGQDVYFAEAVEDEFQLHRKKALDEAQQAFTRAGRAWGKYQQSGGIRGLQRLEAKVSPAYRRLAKLLTESYENITRGLSVYRLLRTDYASEWDTLYTKILKEVRLQRRSLTELAMVLEPSLKQSKLDLLPVPNSVASMEAPDKRGQARPGARRMDSAGGSL
jgi:pSer/pThr/pTyr-binding forkhead associated (FHA) protein